MKNKPKYKFLKHIAIDFGVEPYVVTVWRRQGFVYKVQGGFEIRTMKEMHAFKEVDNT